MSGNDREPDKRHDGIRGPGRDAWVEFKTQSGPERFFAMTPLTDRDSWAALVYWQLDQGCWARLGLTAQRVLKVEVEVGHMPGKDGFLPRRAQADLDHLVPLCDQNPQGTIPTALLKGLPFEPIIEWARTTATRRLQSPLTRPSDDVGSLLPGSPRRLSVAEVAYLYDALVRLGSKNPTDTLAQKIGATLPTVRNKVHRARQQGLLTPTKRGEPGGRLTLEGRNAAERGEHFIRLQKIVEDLFEGKQ